MYGINKLFDEEKEVSQVSPGLYINSICLQAKIFDRVGAIKSLVIRVLFFPTFLFSHNFQSFFCLQTGVCAYKLGFVPTSAACMLAHFAVP